MSINPFLSYVGKKPKKFFMHDFICMFYSHNNILKVRCLCIPHVHVFRRNLKCLFKNVLPIEQNRVEDTYAGHSIAAI